MSLLAVLLMAAVCLYLLIKDIPSMLNQRSYGELCAISVLILIDFSVGVMLNMHLKVPNPADLAALLFAPARSFMEKVMK